MIESSWTAFSRGSIPQIFKKSHFLEIQVHIRNDNGMAASQGLQAVQDLAGKKKEKKERKREKRKESSPFLLIVPMLSFFQAISVQSQIWFLESHFSNQTFSFAGRTLMLEWRI